MAFVVFLLPVVASLLFGSLVMAEVLKDPERELNLMQFDFSSVSEVSSDSLEIIGLEKEYSPSEPIQIQVSVTDSDFDCGDLYITIYDVSSSSKPSVTQGGFFGQCFERNNSLLPVDDEFSEVIDAQGKYEIQIEVIDKHGQKSISIKETFVVK